MSQLVPSTYCQRKMNKRNMVHRSSSNINLNRKTIILGAILVTVAICLLNPTRPNQLVEGKKATKAIKAIVKGLVMQSLSTRKNFLPLPVPIPVPIEINDPPVYLKGKPKYVDVYKQQPKATPKPIIKPTTVYHMPVYSPTYGYMSMDPYSMYSGSMAGHMMYPSAAAGSSYENSNNNQYENMKSSIHTDSNSISATAGINFNDYDDESGSYYVRKSAAAASRRRRGASGASSAQPDDNLDRSDRLAGLATDRNLNRYRVYGHDDEALVQSFNDEEQIDHVDQGRRRSKRQVYYQSGYEGERDCHGFPLEINVKSRIKMDQVFPIFGKSQIKKCIKKIQILPPVEDHHGPYSN